MSKKKQTPNNRDKSKFYKKKHIDKFLFPSTLRGKKYKRIEPQTQLEKGLEKYLYDPWQTYLEGYLETENPDYFFKALRDNVAILQNPGRDLNYESLVGEGEELLNADGSIIIAPTYVDGSTIAWATMNWWCEINHYLNLAKEAEKAKYYLQKIGTSLRPSKKGLIQISTKDGLVHMIVKEKGKKSYLRYKSPNEFIDYWNRVEGAFVGKRKRYKTITKPLIEEMRQSGDTATALLTKTFMEQIPKLKDIRDIIKSKLGGNISDVDLRRFNLGYIGTITACYIAWKHEKVCNICGEKREKKNSEKLPYKTFQRLRKKAEKDIRKSDGSN